jgi:chemosensory pili system protein ChpA (sensor histidine kinase/response regulator)
MDGWRTTLLEQAQILSRKPVVLLAEDNSDIRQLTRLLLESEGCRVIEAADGMEAVQAAECSVPDLILVDIEMPILDGLEVTRHLRQNDCTRQIPILAVTASHERRREALEAGCNAFLRKPLLLEGIRDLLSRYTPCFTHYSEGCTRGLNPCNPQNALASSARFVVNK